MFISCCIEWRLALSGECICKAKVFSCRYRFFLRVASVKAPSLGGMSDFLKYANEVLRNREVALR